MRHIHPNPDVDAACKVCHPESLSIKTFEDGLDEQLAILRDALLSKQHDYGHGNILTFGEQGVLVRASDKVERLKTLCKRVGIDPVIPLNETIEDTWLDLAGYSIIAMMLKADTFKLPLKEDQ